MRVSSKWMMLLLWAMVVGIIAGCGSSNNVQISTDPVTIRVGTTGSATMAEPVFQETVVEPVKKKHPNITVEIIRMGGNEAVKSIGDWMSGGVIPDIILHANGSMGELYDYDLMMDLNPIIKQTKTDLNRFDKAVLDSIRIASDEGWLVGIPFSQNFNALYYNKDIFDKFAAEYPKDGMTWDEVINLSRQVGRTEGGVQYIGLHPQWVLRPAYPLALTLVDAKTERSQVTNDRWKSVVELLQKIVAIPDNWDGKSGAGDFWNKRNVAMLATTNAFTSLAAQAENGFTNWDVAQYPSHPMAPGVSGMVDTWVMIIASSSKHPLQAMQVINIVTSDEIQLLAAAKYAQLSTLADPKMKEQFGSQLPSLNIENKNLQGIFKGKIVPAPKFSPYERNARPFLEGNIAKVFTGEMDINTALRDADEKMNRMLDEQKK